MRNVMAKAIVSIVSMSATAGLAYNGDSILECTNDKRPVDGGMTQMKVVTNADNAGLYDVVLRTAGPRSSMVTEKTIVQAVPCRFFAAEPSVMNCHRSAGEGEIRNSGFKTTLNNKLSVSQYGLEYSFAELEMFTYSDQVDMDKRRIVFKRDQCKTSADFLDVVPVPPGGGIEMPPPSVCMAYWSGWRVDASGQCVEDGASGCTNPFPFQTEEQCAASLN